MITRRAGLVLLVTCVLSFSSLAARLPARESKTPSDFSSVVPTDLLDLDQWKGQVVWLDFWASWCAPCRESFPWMHEMRQRYAEQGLVIVAVNVDRDRSAAERFLEGTDYRFHHVYDPQGRLAEVFALRAMPTSILLDRAGNPIYRHSGFRRDETGEYERHIAELLAQQTVSGQGALSSSPTRRIKVGVKPWERDLLAQEDMFLDNDPLDLEIDDHIYFSKEASSGGRAFGGGGCGCN